MNGWWWLLFAPPGGGEAAIVCDTVFDNWVFGAASEATSATFVSINAPICSNDQHAMVVPIRDNSFLFTFEFTGFDNGLQDLYLLNASAGLVTSIGISGTPPTSAIGGATVFRNGPTEGLAYVLMAVTGGVRVVAIDITGSITGKTPVMHVDTPSFAVVGGGPEALHVIGPGLTSVTIYDADPGNLTSLGEYQVVTVVPGHSDLTGADRTRMMGGAADRSYVAHYNFNRDRSLRIFYLGTTEAVWTEVTCWATISALVSDLPFDFTADNNSQGALYYDYNNNNLYLPLRCTETTPTSAQGSCVSSWKVLCVDHSAKDIVWTKHFPRPDRLAPWSPPRFPYNGSEDNLLWVTQEVSNNSLSGTYDSRLYLMNASTGSIIFEKKYTSLGISSQYFPPQTGTLLYSPALSALSYRVRLNAGAAVQAKNFVILKVGTP